MSKDPDNFLDALRFVHQWDSDNFPAHLEKHQQIVQQQRQAGKSFATEEIRRQWERQQQQTPENPFIDPYWLRQQRQQQQHQQQHQKMAEKMLQWPAPAEITDLKRKLKVFRDSLTIMRNENKRLRLVIASLRQRDSK